jgi:molybdopterin synthase sulfur carrier subunit
MSEPTIELLFFAALQNHTGHAEVRWPFTPNTTLAQLFAAVCQHYQITTSIDRLRVARNHQFAQWHDVIQQGDVVAFIPPVSGG